MHPSVELHRLVDAQRGVVLSPSDGGQGKLLPIAV